MHHGPPRAGTGRVHAPKFPSWICGRPMTPLPGACKTLWANPLDAHPGLLAHRLAAEQIVEAFGPVWKSKALESGGKRQSNGRE